MYKGICLCLGQQNYIISVACIILLCVVYLIGSRVQPFRILTVGKV